MEFIKTEPDPDAELFPASCDEGQSVDVKVEEKPVFVSLPPVDAGNDVSCLSICSYKLHVVVKNCWPLPWYLFVNFDIL
jgi:predicted metal-binding protein